MLTSAICESGNIGWLCAPDSNVLMLATSESGWLLDVVLLIVMLATAGHGNIGQLLLMFQTCWCRQLLISCSILWFWFKCAESGNNGWLLGPDLNMLMSATSYSGKSVDRVNSSISCRLLNSMLQIQTDFWFGELLSLGIVLTARFVLTAQFHAPDSNVVTSKTAESGINVWLLAPDSNILSRHLGKGI